MESHGDLMRPQQGPQGRITADRLWQELGELLNSLGGGLIKPLDKWKKVWADWKTKTKKKALVIRCEASGTGGGPSSRQALTALEERVLGIMGLTAVIGLAGIEERGFDAPPSERNSLPPPTRDSVHTVCPSQISATDEIMLDFIQATPASTATYSLWRTSTPSSTASANAAARHYVCADAVSNVAYHAHVTAGSAAAAASGKPVARGVALYFHAAAPRAASSAHTANTNALRTGYERVRGCRASPATTRGRPGKKLPREGDGKVAIRIEKK